MKNLLLLFLFLWLNLSQTYGNQTNFNNQTFKFNPAIISENEPTIDDEYDRYKKRGDDFFVQGEYQKAIAQYQNCLEVPNFSNDLYAKERITLANKLATKRQDAFKLLDTGKGEEAISLLKEILESNQNDPITKTALTEYLTSEATKLYTQKNYSAAKARYREAVKYAAKPDLLLVQIQNCDDFIKNEQKIVQAPPVIKDPIKEETKIVEKPKSPSVTKEAPSPKVEKKTPEPITSLEFKPKRRIIPKIVFAAIGLGAGGYAYLLNNQYQSKLSTLNSIAAATDPDADNLILTPAEYGQWRSAYDDVKNAQSQSSILKTCLGVAAGAAIVEIILLISKPKQRKLTGFHLQPGNQNIGLAIQYRF